MRLIALKVDVDTLRGTLEGVPRLLPMLAAGEAGATFLFSLGPDHTGRAIRRIFRPGFFSKVSRTSVLEHYGWKTLMYGTLLPGPDIGIEGAAVMRSVRDQGFEVGVHCWDHVEWQDGVATADEAWTRREMQRAVERFGSIFGEPPRVHGAAGWQMNPHAYRLQAELGFRYASDSRGRAPYQPSIDGKAVGVVQLPTTLPTLDELIGLDGLDETNVERRLLQLTEASHAAGHVFTLHTELEGGKLAPVFERLLAGWRRQGYALVSLADYRRALGEPPPLAPVTVGEVPGRSGTLAVQP